MSNIRVWEITEIQISLVHLGLKQFKLACILFFTLLTAASRCSKATLALHRNPACSPANWLGQRSEGQWLWRNEFPVSASIIQWFAECVHCSELQKGHKLCQTQLCQHFPQSRGFEGLLDQVCISQYPETQTYTQTDAPQLQPLCVCSGTVRWWSWKENKPLWNIFWHSAGEDGNIKQWRQCRLFLTHGVWCMNHNLKIMKTQTSFTLPHVVETHILQNAFFPI